jgi:diguanylate cyclase (GGDEF)-like protein/PAS domain S-box-containing protein
MNVALFKSLPLNVSVVLFTGMAGVIAGVVGVWFAADLFWIRFFDNLHWTSATAAAAVVAWLSFRTAPPGDSATLRYIAIGLSGYAVGQVIWDIQVFVGYAGFPSPSDLFYLWLGPCIAVGLSRAAFRLADQARRNTLMLDALIFAIAALTLMLALYLPHRGDMTLPQLAILVAYPSSLFAAACIGLIAIPALQLRFTWGYGLFLLSLIATGLCWMLWNRTILYGEATDGLWFNSLFSFAVMGMGAATCRWNLEKSENARWERFCEGFLRQLPLLAVVGASASVAAAHLLENIPKISVITGMLAVILLAAVRQNALLADYDLFKKTTRELEESRNLLRAILDNSTVVVYLKDLDGKYLLINARFEELFHITLENILGKTDYDVFPKEFADVFRANDLAVIAKGKAIETEEHAPHADGIHDYISVKFPLRDPKNKIAGVCGISTDITERKRSEEALWMSEARLDFLISSSPGIIYSAKGYGDYGTTFVSSNITAQLGYQPADFTGDANFWVNHIHPDDKDRVLKELNLLFANNSHTHEYRFQHRDGSYRWMHDQIHVVRNADGSPRELVGYWIDITERKEAEQEMRIAATAFETQEGIIITDADQIILRVNRAFTEITGYAAEEAVGNRPSILKSDRHDDSFYRKMHATLHEKGFWRGEIWDRHKRGHIYPKWLVITAVKNALGKITHYVGNFADITQRKADEEKIRNLAFYDTLTDLPNRRLLTERLSHAIAAGDRVEGHGALLYLDLDNFKALNDTQGHPAGDRLLVEVARRMACCVRDADTVSRLGGDEFVVLLENLDSDGDSAALEVKRVAEKILTTFGEPFALSSGEYYCSASIGIALFAGHQTPHEAVLSRADTAMYEAKKSGKNAYRFFDPAMQKVLEYRMELESALRQAIANRQFLLFYQIQVDQRQCPIGVEALIRWQHPQRGLVSPYEFIPIAEETGMILDIGKWALEAACIQLKDWERAGHTRNMSIAVNVSVKQFYQAAFVEDVRKIVAHYAIDPSKLKLELTESIVLEKVEEAIENMHLLKSLGISLSMDDFGTGYSSLSYLKRLPFDQVKIDKSFVAGVNEHANDRFIASTVIGMGKLLGINVIAEGVENDKQYEFLKALGCQSFQGYLFGKPEPARNVEMRLAHRSPADDAHKPLSNGLSATEPVVAPGPSSRSSRR